jgi:hypothetical protein
MHIPIQLESKKILKERLASLNNTYLLPIAKEIGGQQIRPIDILMSIETALYRYQKDIHPNFFEMENILEDKDKSEDHREVLLFIYLQKKEKQLSRETVELKHIRALAIENILPNHPDVRKHFNETLSYENFHNKYCPLTCPETGRFIYWITREELEKPGSTITANTLVAR